MKHVKKWIALPLVILLAIMTGCEAVGGFDINKALLNSVEVQSGESKQTLSIHVEPADHATTEDKKIIDFINSSKLTIDHAITESQTKASVKGTFEFSEGKFPFHISMDTEGIAILLEGAKEPFYASHSEETALTQAQLLQYSEEIQEFRGKATSFVLKHLPNPSKISVKQAQEKINEETLSLTHLATEIDGEEAVKLIKPFLSSIVKDEQGLKEIIGAFYDTMYPVLNASMGLDAVDNESLDTNRDLAVAGYYGVIHEVLTQLIDTYDEEVAAVLAEDENLQTVFGKDTVIKTDFYFDSSLNLRKQKLEAKIALPTNDELPLKSVTIKGESELWNVGSKVSIDAVNVKAGKLDLTSTELTPGQVLRNFDSNSLIYKLLKDKLNITAKHIEIGNPGDYYEVINKNGTTFVPLRYLAVELDAKTKWNGETQTITLIDDITGDEVVLKVGSKQASVAGQTVTMSEPAFIHSDGKTYVPLRFIAEALGAKVYANSEGWITITRN